MPAAACLGSRRSTCVAVFRFGSSLAWVAFRYTQEGGEHTSHPFLAVPVLRRTDLRHFFTTVTNSEKM